MIRPSNGGAMTKSEWLSEWAAPKSASQPFLLLLLEGGSIISHFTQIPDESFGKEIFLTIVV